VAERVENTVIESLKEVFNAIKTTPQEKAVEVRFKKQIRLQKEAIKKQEARMEALSKELRTLKDEVVNALMGTGKFSADLLGGLIADKEQALRTAIEERNTLVNCLEDKQASMDSLDGQYREFVSWADEFENCSHEKAQMIIAYLVDHIEIDRGYTIKIHLNTVYEQFLSAVA
jgi:ElaB/YqjD/DUF883 family membrane-anchored ribosome-binding protein